MKYKMFLFAILCFAQEPKVAPKIVPLSEVLALKIKLAESEAARLALERTKILENVQREFEKACSAASIASANCRYNLQPVPNGLHGVLYEVTPAPKESQKEKTP